MTEYCTKCGSKVIEKETRKGTYHKRPDYFDSETGKPLTHTHWSCPNQTFFGSHTEFFTNNR